MEKQRLLIWVVLTTLFLVGVLTLRSRLAPKPPAEPPAPPTLNAVQVDDIVRALPPWLSYLPSPFQFRVVTDLRWQPVFLAKAAEVRRREEVRAAAQLQAAEAGQPDEDIVLGGPQDKLRVVLSARGAAVRSVTLTAYEAATRLEARPTGQPLVLVSDDEDGLLAEIKRADERRARQSFRLLVDQKALDWQVREKADHKAVFAAELPEKNVRFVKTFELTPGRYHVDLELRLEAIDPSRKAEVTYELTGPQGVPAEGQLWKTIPYRYVVLGTVDSRYPTKALRHLRDNQTVKKQTDAIRQKKEEYANLLDKDREKPVPETEKIELLKKIQELERELDFRLADRVQPLADQPEPQELQFAGVMSQYFTALVVVDGDPTQTGYVEKVTSVYSGDDPADANPKLRGRVTALLTSRPVKLEANKPVVHNYLLYTGPSKVRLLGYEDGVEPGLADRYENGLHMSVLTDYPSDNRVSRFFYTIGWTKLLIFMTNVMHSFLEFLADYVVFWLPWRYGFAIMLLTLTVRAMMFPITRKTALTSQRMQKLQPEIKKLQEKYKNDRQALMQAQMELYRKYGVNPMGGCLPLLIQMPVFMGLYYALQESTHLRLAHFLWAENLAAPDMLLYWANWPVVGWLTGLLGPYLNLLPIIAVTLMLIQQMWMMPPPADEQQAMQMKMMNVMMIFMGYMFYWVAAGLCVYFIISSGWGMLERKLIPKITHQTPGAEAAGPAPRAGAGGERSKPKPPRNGSPDGWQGRLSAWWKDLLEQAKKK
jgi:YidC/Oxa1 family membrane protein insertase